MQFRISSCNSDPVGSPLYPPLPNPPTRTSFAVDPSYLTLYVGEISSTKNLFVHPDRCYPRSHLNPHGGPVVSRTFLALLVLRAVPSRQLTFPCAGAYHHSYRGLRVQLSRPSLRRDRVHNCFVSFGLPRRLVCVGTKGSLL
jgi:hypothetical protein